MTRHLSRFGAFATAAAVALTLALPVDLAAQRTQTGGDDGGRRTGDGDGGRAVAIPRGGGDAGPRGGGGDSGGGRVSSGGGSDAGRAPAPRTDAGTSDRSGNAVARRPREDRPATGLAIPRSEVPLSPVDTVIVTGGSYYGGYYPWGYGGIGLGGYYGWYDPFWYDPYYYGGGGGYYGAYNGRLRLKVKPSNAEVFVDGYFAGEVDEFDNIFQHLEIETGPHRIEVREDGYEPLTFEVRILPGRTVTYRGELKKNQ
jgi:hypothetical protein